MLVMRMSEREDAELKMSKLCLRSSEEMSRIELRSLLGCIDNFGQWVEARLQRTNASVCVS